MAKHPKAHHSDHSGAHAVGTAHHEAHAHDAHDGLTKSERGTEGGDSSGFSERGNEGHADMHLSEHPTKLELPALHHNEGQQE